LSRGFAEYYLSQQVGNAFQNFYDNTTGSQNHFVGFWQQVAGYFKNTDTVLGYELINEPWAGDIFRYPSLLLPKEADRRNLAPLYKKLHQNIRPIDDQHILFFEQALTDIIGTNGFDEGPGGPTYNDRQVYSYHLYCAPVDQNGNPRNIIECDAIDDLSFVTDMLNLKRIGCGGMLTEFGAMANATVSIESISALTSVADANLQSWSYWQFKLFNDLTTAGPGESFYENGELEKNKVKALSRTYAQAIAGIPSLMSFEPSDSSFRLVYLIDPTAKAPTEIYLNEEYYYPNGFTVTITPSNAAVWKQVAKNHIEVYAASNQVQSVRVNIIQG